MRSRMKKALVRVFMTPHGRSLAALAAALAGLFSQCVFNSQISEQPVTLKSLDANGDTLSVFPRLRFVFSPPIADTSVDVRFSPAISSGYGASLNGRGDTLTVDFMEMLQGNTRYVFRLAEPVTSAGGSTWDLSGDSAVFYTFAREQEINDQEDVADPLTSVVFGSVSDASDIDMFACDRSSVRAVYLQSIDCRDSFSVEDDNSTLFVVGGTMRQTDTIVLGENAAFPVFIVVRSGIKGFEGKYKLGIINR
jgi:hypothetical protein